jgi:hypothetical protein
MTCALLEEVFPSWPFSVLQDFLSLVKASFKFLQNLRKYCVSISAGTLLSETRNLTIDAYSNTYPHAMRKNFSYLYY